jgi:DNA-binding IclR family transcriptional regulator
MDNNLPALERALDTLELLGAYPGGLSAADIGEHTGIPRATLYRILRLLRQREFLAGAPEAATRLVLGPALARLAALAPGERELRARVQPSPSRLRIRRAICASHRASARVGRCTSAPRSG